MATNLDPKIWGPHIWYMLHYTAATYDDNPNTSVKGVMKTFIQSIPVLLPCKTCQDHAFEYIRAFDLDKVVKNREELFLFFFHFHNAVNYRLKKPLMKLETAIKKYHVVPRDDHLLHSTLNPHYSSQYWLLGFVCFLFIVWFVYIKLYC